jgi:signal transduction histidine kinase
MQLDLRQERAMIPDMRATSSGAVLDTTALLRELAAAPDWGTLSDVLARAIPALLPATRLDVYVTDPNREARLRFSTDVEHAPAVAEASEVLLRYQLQREGYGAIMIVGMNAAGQQRGWVALARRQERIASAAQTLAEQIAPLLAVWLCQEQHDTHSVAVADRVSLLEQRVRSTDALRLRATLVAGAAHDIGNLFTAMMGYAQLLQQDLPPVFQSDIAMIIRTVEDGRQLLRRLYGGTTPALTISTTTLVAPILHEVVKLTRPFWERRAGMHIETKIEGSATVRMPAQDLREVLVNLIMNAITAIREDGAITLVCRVQAGRVLISVVDTGDGIAREHHGAIFQPFMTTRPDGSGLGLSVSRALVEGYGGSLTVDSAPSSGATFTISLPRAP